MAITKLSMNYAEFVTALIIMGILIMGILTAINFFCCIVVFTFRKDLIMAAQGDSFPKGIFQLNAESNL